MQLTILSIFTVIALFVMVFIFGMIVLSMQEHNPEDFLGITKRQLNVTLTSLLSATIVGTFIAAWV